MDLREGERGGRVAIVVEQRRSVCAPRPVEVAELFEHVAHQGPGASVLAIDRQRGPQQRERIRKRLHAKRSAGAGDQDLGLVAVDPEQSFSSGEIGEMVEIRRVEHDPWTWLSATSSSRLL